MTPQRRDNELDNNDNSNPDAITGTPGSHPIGTGVGAAGGGLAGAAIGAAIGAGATGPAAPVGTVVGAVIGAVAGGLAGKGAAEAINPTAEDAYWRTNYANRPYYSADYTYDDDYRPAYEYGWTARTQSGGRRFEDVESDLAGGWEKARSSSRLTWDQAKAVTRDAWDRIDNPDLRSAPAVGAPQAYPGTDVADRDVDDFAASYCTRYPGRRFDEVEPDLRRDWDTNRSGRSGKTWDTVKDSVRRAWHKVERAMPGDADRDGR
jgi:hypothetical protein